MEAKEKSKELISKFLLHADKKARPSAMSNPISQRSNIAALLSNQSGVTYNVKDLLDSAKQCALIAVEEILDILGGAGVYSFADEKVSEYWEQVKKEIKKYTL